MGTIRTMRVVLLAVALCVVSGAYAQGSEVAAASSVSDAKAGKAADRALQKNVLRALSKTKDLRVAGITVRAHDGAVILEGMVPEEAQIGLATQAAQGVEGVKSVRNALTLSTL